MADEAVIVVSWRVLRVFFCISLLIIGSGVLLLNWSWLTMDFPRYFFDDIIIWLFIIFCYSTGVIGLISEVKRNEDT